MWLALSQPTPEDLGTFGTSLAISPFAVIDDYERSSSDESESIYHQKRRVEQLTRAVHPALAVLDSLARGESQRSPETFRAFLGDVRDRARGVSDETVMLSSALDGLLDDNVAQVTVRQNVIIQKVSASAAIAAAPTIITGVYGMNFPPLPGAAVVARLPVHDPSHDSRGPGASLELPARRVDVRPTPGPAQMGNDSIGARPIDGWLARRLRETRRGSNEVAAQREGGTTLRGSALCRGRVSTVQGYTAWRSR